MDYDSACTLLCHLLIDTLGEVDFDQIKKKNPLATARIGVSCRFFDALKGRSPLAEPSEVGCEPPCAVGAPPAEPLILPPPLLGEQRSVVRWD